MARIKEWEELTICDNFLFQKVMQNKRLCKRLIQNMTLMMESKQQRREGFDEGKAEGKAEGQDSARLNSIRSLMDSLHLTAQQAMDALKIPVNEQSKYASQI